MTGVPTLSDGTVTLRAHRDDDIGGAYEQCQDPQTQRWTTVPVPYSRADAERFVRERMPAAWADGSSWAFAVEAEGRYAGTVELRDEGDHRAEVAYAAHPRARGTGTMERALRLLLAWGFQERAVETVVWLANRGNWASRKLAWRVGFSFDGTLRRYLTQRGETHDAWVGTRLAGDDGRPQGRWLDVPVLETDRLRLRAWRPSDVPRIIEACSDARTQQWLGRMPDPYDEGEAHAWLEHISERCATGRGVTWAVADPASDVPLAAVSCFDLEPEQQAEIGYWAHPDARGRGVMTRAVGEVVRYAFEDLGVRRVLAAAAAGNSASEHVIEANGLSAWGTERLGTTVAGGRTDLVWYDVMVEEWRRSRRSLGF